MNGGHGYINRKRIVIVHVLTKQNIIAAIKNNGKAYHCMLTVKLISYSHTIICIKNIDILNEVCHEGEL